MSIFSKKNKSTIKESDSIENHEKTSNMQDEKPQIKTTNELNINKTTDSVDSVYPWLEQKKIEEPLSNDFQDSIYVDEPKWKHHTNQNLPTPPPQVKEKPVELKVKNNETKIDPTENKTNIAWDKENKIDEPNQTDFLGEEYVAEPKWKKQKPQITKKVNTFSTSTPHGLTVKETPQIKEEIIFDKIKKENTEIRTNLVSEEKTIAPPIENTQMNTDSLSKLKELAAKKEKPIIEQPPSGKQLQELLKKEFATEPINKTNLFTKTKPIVEETKLDWLKKEIIDEPLESDFSNGEITHPKWKHPTSSNENTFQTKTIPQKTDEEYNWMKHDNIEEPRKTDFATETKETISKPSWPITHDKQQISIKDNEVNTTIHPKWAHEEKKSKPTNSEDKPNVTAKESTKQTITEITEPKWKKDAVPIKRKRASLKTPIDEIFELLESYKQADTAELASYTSIDVYTIEKIMRTFEDYGIVEVKYPTTLGKKPTIILKKEVESRIIKAPEGKILESYEITVDFIPAKISIILVQDEARPIYNIEMPSIGKYTRSFLNYLKNEIAETLPIELDEITDPKKAKTLKDKFFTEAKKHLAQYVPEKDTDMLDQLSGVVLHEMYGLGDLEVIMGDDMLEEVAINSAKTPVTVYHRIHGWLKTNLLPGTEEDIMNYSSQIGRKIGREITVLNPILDAHLLSGDRVNATLFPISAEGNTLTIRRFARRPWTIVDFMGKAHTMNTQMAALLWLAMQYELNVIISGGTASGKTSALNTLLSLVPSYHRVISIEDVRELVLPKYLKWNWIPMVTRSKNPEGMGGVTMLDCMVTSLRMRPDRIIVGEIRRKREAEVLMEAIETGHSIYSTIHANSAYQVLRRLAEPPMSIPPMQIELIDLVVVQYRDRKTNRRRTYEISEIEQTSTGQGLQVNTIYKWSPRTDDWEQLNRPTKILTLLNLHTGLTEEEIERELNTREQILDWMRVQNINELNMVGYVMKLYYSDAQRVIKLAKDKTTRIEIEKMME